MARPLPRPRACLLPVPAAALVVAALSFGTAGPATAAARVQVTVADVEWQGVQAREVGVVLLPGSAGAAAAVTVRAAAVEGLDAAGRIEALRATCPALRVSGESLACAGGRLAGRFGILGAQDTPITVAARAADRWELSLPALRVAGGSLGVTAAHAAAGWTARLAATELALGELLALDPARQALPAGLSASGSLTGSLQLAGRGARLVAAQGTADLKGLTFANEAGTLAGELLAGRLEVEAAPAPAADGWTLAGTVGLPSGQAYLEPVFVDFGEHALDGRLSGRLSPGADALVLDALRLSQRGIGAVEGSARIALGTVPALAAARLHFTDIDLGGAVKVFAAPLLISTDFADLQGAGRISGEVDVEAGLPSRLELTLHDVLLDSVSGALSVEGLAGDFSWFDDQLRNELAPQVDSAVFKSRLDWRMLRLWGIEFGPASLPFTTTGRHFRLLDPVLLPVFDGGLAVETLRIRHAGTPRMYLRFDAELRPISVARIGRALGWPEFSGTLSGRIPKLELADGLVTLGGNIEAKVFDGAVTLSGLRMRDPLGQYPQLFADIEIDALDLEQLTGTFEFGMITGRLSGYVQDLEMFDWMPVSFEARLYSTPGDRTPHRISQRAVSNLSSIGGGSGGTVAAALQSGFLRFFDDFRYDRLGLSCTLANDVCRMDGIAPAPGGYYIVKGSGLPRIDVIGNQRRVAWTRLVRQLGAITQSSGPVVQ